MKINIYYGGRGLVDDPTLSVLNRMENVFEELRVQVMRYNLSEKKSNITTLPQTLKEADGIILAATVEWFGIGGYMQQFLDAIWLYGNKEKIQTIFMQPIVMSTTHGEREGMLNLINAWETLGGQVCNGLSGYVDDLATFETNKDYNVLIERAAENLYRTISQKLVSLPSSNLAVQKAVLRTAQIELTPQESEQLSQFVSDDTYVKKQKEDIEELTSMFKGMLGEKEKVTDISYIEDFEEHFVVQEDVSAVYELHIKEKDKTLVLEVHNDTLQAYYGEAEQPDIEAKLGQAVLEEIIAGRMTFQRAFMSGEMTAKGNFKTLRQLDQIFVFME